MTTQATPDRLLRSSDVSEMCAISRTTIWRLVTSGDFPPPVKIGTGSAGNRWRQSDIDAWIAALTEDTSGGGTQ